MNKLLAPAAIFVAFSIAYLTVYLRSDDAKIRSNLQAVVQAEKDYHQKNARYAARIDDLQLAKPPTPPVYLETDKVPEKYQTLINDKNRPFATGRSFQALSITEKKGDLSIWVVSEDAKIHRVVHRVKK